MTHDPPTLSTHVITLDVSIAARREVVWRSLIDDIGLWWHEDFLVTTGDRRLALEARVGGRLLEESSDGSGLLWYTVTAIQPEQSLNLVGHIQPPFGGPSTSMLHISLEDHGDGTLLRLTDHSFGVIPDSARDNTAAGWGQLLEDCLKRYVEEQV